jgi:hypothetical protein
MVAIAFYHPTTFYGKLISWFTGTPWSHVALQHTVVGIPVFTQALVGRGVVPVVVANYDQADLVTTLDWIPEEWATKWLASKWCQNYSLYEVMGFVFRKFKLRVKIKDRSGYFCSELAAEFLHTAFTELQPFKGPLAAANDRNMKLRDLYAYLQKTPKIQVKPSDLVPFFV